MLAHREPHRHPSPGQTVLDGLDLEIASRRGARHHGTQRGGQEHPGQRPRRPRRLRRHRHRHPRRHRPARAAPPRTAPPPGVFLAFQYPTEIPGVGNMYFLRAALNAVRRDRGLDEIAAVDFLTLAKEHMARLDMDPAFLSRSR